MRSTTATQRAELRELLEPYAEDFTSEQTGLSREDLSALSADVLAAGRLAVVAGTGITFQPNALLTSGFDGSCCYSRIRSTSRAACGSARVGSCHSISPKARSSRHLIFRCRRADRNCPGSWASFLQ